MSVTLTRTHQTLRPACADARAVFHHPLLEEPPSRSNPADERRLFELVRDQAAEVCRSCPLVAQCLYTAVVEHDVAGYVAGTLPEERKRIRRRLSISIAPESLEGLTGGSGAGRVDVDRRAGAAKPSRAEVTESLIALRRSRPSRRVLARV